MKKYLIVFIILTGLFSVSCDDFLDVNTDPNNPTVVTPDLTLPVGLNYTARLQGQDRGMNHLGNMLMYNWSETYGFSWYDEEFKYLVTSTFYDQLFDEQYEDCLKQYADLDKYGDEYMSYKAIAQIMKAYHFQLLVDLYGNVPYSEALKRGLNSTPVYDDAETIYRDLMVQLTAAIEMINEAEAMESSEYPENDDVVFGGDMTSWKQFANSIKLRLLARAQGTFDVASELATIDAEGSGFVASDVMVNPGYLVETNKQNYYWDELGWGVDGTQTLSHDATCATQYLIDYLTTTNDPRLDYIYEVPASGNGHLGVEQGSNPGDDYAADFVSNIGPGHLKSATMGQVIMTAAEVNFNLAELALASGDAAGAEMAYNAGVAASFAYLGVAGSDTLIGQYLSQITPNVAWNGTLEAIITQKWLAVNGVDAIQSWFDYSRTGFPANLPISLLASTPDRPVRLAYPSSEITGNTGNVPSQPDAFNTKIFWAN